MDARALEAYRDTRRFRAYLNAGRFVAAALIIALVAPVLFAFQSASLAQFLAVIGAAILVAGAAFALGGIVGFLFGIPRALQETEASAPPEGESLSDAAPSAAQERARYVGNTNLEQISDWLTKILVGVGLTQLVNIPSGLAALGGFLAPALGGFGSSAMFGVLQATYYAVGGFFLTYLWARLYLASLLAESDLEALKAARHEDELRALEATSPMAPVMAPAAASEQPLSVPAARRVLWVDDRPANNSREIRQLEVRGIGVDTATSTEEALKLLTDNPGKYSLVISDMARGLQRRAGYDLLNEARRRGLETPYIIYAGSGQPEQDAEAKQRGALGSTNSPIRLFELINQALARAPA